MRKMLAASSALALALPVFVMSGQVSAQSFDYDNGTGNIVEMIQPQWQGYEAQAYEGQGYEARAEVLPAERYRVRRGYGAYTGMYGRGYGGVYGRGYGRGYGLGYAGAYDRGYAGAYGRGAYARAYAPAYTGAYARVPTAEPIPEIYQTYPMTISTPAYSRH